MRPITYERSADGQISVGGVRLDHLAREFGTPLYVMDYATIVEHMAQYREAVADWGKVFYAAKAFCCQAMLELAQRQGLGVDVVSGGELYTGLMADIDPGRMLFHGNAKSEEEIRAGLDARVGYFVVDSLEELSRLEAQASEMGVSAAVLLRLTPGIAAHTHEYIRTGEFDSKFGFATVGGYADEAVDRALNAEHLHLAGFHSHVGSQIMDTRPFEDSAQALLAFSRDLYVRRRYWPRVLDIGGGLGVAHLPGEVALTPRQALSLVARILREQTPAGLTPPEVWVEPGRSIVAQAGLTLYRVQTVKSTPTGRAYVTVDGGMGDNMRPALYGAEYTAEVDAKSREAEQRTVAVAGRYCESGDVLIDSSVLSDPQVEDLLVIWATGAYNYSMASTYNRVPRPAVVMVNQGRASLWVERESWRDLTRGDRPLDLGEGRG